MSGEAQSDSIETIRQDLDELRREHEQLVGALAAAGVLVLEEAAAGETTAEDLQRQHAAFVERIHARGRGGVASRSPMP